MAPVINTNISPSGDVPPTVKNVAETANLTRGQILQQAVIAVLAQANTAPQSGLSLLG